MGLPRPNLAHGGGFQRTHHVLPLGTGCECCTQPGHLLWVGCGCALTMPWARGPAAPRGTCCREGRAGPYHPRSLLGKGLHQGLHAIVQEHGGVVEKLLVAVRFPLDDEGVRHQPVPVIELVELHRDAIPVLELPPEQQLGVKLEAQEVPAEVLDVVFNDDLDGLPWAGGERRRCQLAAGAAAAPAGPDQPRLPQGSGQPRLLMCCARLPAAACPRSRLSLRPRTLCRPDLPDIGLAVGWEFLSFIFSPGKVSLPKTKWFHRKLTPIWSLKTVWWHRGSFISLL